MAAVVTLGSPIKPVARTTTWMKAGASSVQAHYIKTAGSKFFVTACHVALLRSTAVGTTPATMRCFECYEAAKKERGGVK